MRKLSGPIAAILLNAVLGACSMQQEKPDATAEVTVAERELWQSHNIEDYSFTLHVDCFCVVRGPIQLEVRDGQLVTSHLELEQRPLAEHELQYVPTTIPALFDLIAEERADASSNLEVEYAEDLGYPTSVVIDKEKMAFDGGRAYRVSGFSRSNSEAD